MSAARRVRIVSFGYLHGAPPEAHLTADLRTHFRDPHAVAPAERHRTGLDPMIQRIVRATPGVELLIQSLALAVTALASGPSATETVVATGCAGGKHRAVVAALTVAERLAVAGFDVTVEHRDIDRAVVERTADGRHLSA